MQRVIVNRFKLLSYLRHWNLTNLALNYSQIVSLYKCILQIFFLVQIYHAHQIGCLFDKTQNKAVVNSIHPLFLLKLYKLKHFPLPFFGSKSAFGIENRSSFWLVRTARPSRGVLIASRPNQCCKFSCSLIWSRPSIRY